MMGDVAAAPIGVAARSAGSRKVAATYRIAVSGDWQAVAGRWQAAARDGSATPFQHAGWLGPWYRTLGREPGVEPVLVEITDAASGVMAMLLPLVRRRVAGLAVLAFADGDITDYNAPILGPASPVDRAGAEMLWRDLRAALPAADLLDFRKLPVSVAGRGNPLALIAAARPSPMNGNVIVIDGPWEAYHRGLEKTVRKELERSWRVFTRTPDARFVAVCDAGAAQQVVATMELQQRERMRTAGKAYALDAPAAAEFYRGVVADGLASGYAVVTALMAGEDIVAGLLGIRQGDTYVMVRIANAGHAWAHCSPGRLVIDRTMAHLHGTGVRTFDFSIGNYAYKRRLGVTPLALADIAAAQSWRGLPAQTRARAVARLRTYPGLDAALRRLAGRTHGNRE